MIEMVDNIFVIVLTTLLILCNSIAICVIVSALSKKRELMKRVAELSEVIVENQRKKESQIPTQQHYAEQSAVYRKPQYREGIDHQALRRNEMQLQQSQYTTRFPPQIEQVETAVQEEKRKKKKKKKKEEI